MDSLYEWSPLVLFVCIIALTWGWDSDQWTDGIINNRNLKIPFRPSLAESSADQSGERARGAGPTSLLFPLFLSCFFILSSLSFHVTPPPAITFCAPHSHNKTTQKHSKIREGQQPSELNWNRSSNKSRNTTRDKREDKKKGIVARCNREEMRAIHRSLGSAGWKYRLKKKSCLTIPCGTGRRSWSAEIHRKVPRTVVSREVNWRTAWRDTWFEKRQKLLSRKLLICAMTYREIPRRCLLFSGWGFAWILCPMGNMELAKKGHELDASSLRFRASHCNRLGPPSSSSRQWSEVMDLCVWWRVFVLLITFTSDMVEFVKTNLKKSKSQKKAKN